MTTVDDIWSLVEPYLAAERLELDDLELSGSGEGRFLRVVVDGDHLDVDRLADLSHGISRILDDQTDLAESYNLEVTSPGLERKLNRPSHFTKSVGREVKVKVRDEEGSRTYHGVISRAGVNGFTVDADGGTLELSYQEVLTAKTVFRWEKARKPGH